MAGSIPLHCSLNNTLDRNDKSEHTPQLGECSSDYHCLSGGFIPDISVSPPESNLLRWPLIQKRGARERTDDVLLFRRNKNTSEQSILYSDVVHSDSPKSNPVASSAAGFFSTLNVLVLQEVRL